MKAKKVRSPSEQIGREKKGGGPRRFTRRDFLEMTGVTIAALALPGCQPAGPAAEATSTPLVPTPVPYTPSIPPTTPPTATPTLIRYASTEPYFYYDFADSFETVSDLDSYGITSDQNSVKVNTTNASTGHQCLEADGTIAGAAGSSIYMDFDPQKYIGGSPYDFSKKVIVLRAFIPTDSPIDGIWVEVLRGQELVLLAGAQIQDPKVPIAWYPKGITSLPKGQWVEAVVDVHELCSRNGWAYGWGPGGKLANDEASDVVRSADGLRIRGLRVKDGSPVSTYFLLDDLRWLERDSIRIDPQAASLRNYAANTHLRIGCAATEANLLSVVDAKYSQVLAQEFNLLVLGAFAWYIIEPTEGVLDLTKHDAMVDFAVGNHMAIKNYIGGVNTQLPSWMMNKSFSELRPILLDCIDTVGHRYQGKIAEWYVFHEIVNGHGPGFKNRQGPRNDLNAWSPWVDGNDTSLIKDAFRHARISDPNAKLFLNDFNTEEIGQPRSEFFYNFVKELVTEGVPIDGVAFEMHAFYPMRYPWSAMGFPRVNDLPGYLKNVDANIKRYAALGLLVDFAEVDVAIPTSDLDTTTKAGQDELKRRLDYQGQIYGSFMKTALANPNVSSFSTWDGVDRYAVVYNAPPNGLPGYGYPDMFDAYYAPKPAYFAVRDTLASYQAVATPTP